MISRVSRGDYRNEYQWLIPGINNTMRIICVRDNDVTDLDRLACTVCAQEIAPLAR